MYNFKYKIGDKVQLNKVKGLNYGDFYDTEALKLGKAYRISDRIIAIGNYQNCNIAYRIEFETPKGKRIWWVGECDVTPVNNQLTFVFTD